MVWLEFWNFVHFIGLAFGLGGATFAYVISRKAEKNPDIAKSIGKLMPSIVKYLWLGLFLLIVSGIALPFYISYPLNKQMLILKHILVAWIVIIGIVMGIKMKKINRIKPEPSLREKPTRSFISTQKQMKFFSTLNLILWYLVTLLSVFV